jgi:porin
VDFLVVVVIVGGVGLWLVVRARAFLRDAFFAAERGAPGCGSGCDSCGARTKKDGPCPAYPKLSGRDPGGTDQATTEEDRREPRASARLYRVVLLTVSVAGWLCPVAIASDSTIGNRFELHGVLAGATQGEGVRTPDGTIGEDGASVPFQIELSLAPSRSGLLFAKLGFAAGDDLGEFSAFNLAPWGADQEAHVRDINGRDRDHLLTAWYRYTFEWSATRSLALTGGIIDATDYIDQNAYANDEYTQFLNEALVNGPNSFAPSYDIGGAATWSEGALTLTGVFMQVGENEDGNTFHYYGTQVGYRHLSGWGEGNYRVVLQSTDRSFLDCDGIDLHARRIALVSLDQQLGGAVGVWGRGGRQDNAAAITYKDLYSGGIDISGAVWNRENDNAGIGYAYLDGGNLELESTRVFEVYARFSISDDIQITGDIQYMEDAFEGGGGRDGFVYGLRVAAAF